MRTTQLSVMRGRSAPARRGAAATAAVIVGLVGITGCSESAGPEQGAVTVEDLQGIEEDLGALQERVGVLEEGVGAEEAAAEPGVADDGAELFGDAESFVGQEATVSAEVSAIVTTTDVGSAFRIAGEGGEPIAVLSANPPGELDESDVVQVSGVVKRVQRDTFEQDFGVAADELFDDPDAFFETEEGQPAISADRIEVLQEQADD